MTATRQTGRVGSALAFLKRWWTVAPWLALVCCVRLRLLNVPLERDEGDHAYSAWLMLQGIPPWKLSYNMKFPGTDAIYALSMALFGQTAAGIHAGLLIANLVTMILLVLLGRRWFSDIAGSAAAAAYAAFSLSPNILPMAAHAPYFVMPAVLTGLLLLPAETEIPARMRLVRAGLAFGLAVLMKQPGALFAVFPVAFLWWNAARSGRGIREAARQMIFFLAGFLAPLSAMMFGVWSAGVFETFWFWTFTLARSFAAVLPMKARLENLLDAAPQIVVPNGPLWALAALGVVFSIVNRTTRESGMLLAGFLAVSFAAVSAGGLFSSHYFVMLFPAAALAVGVAAELLSRTRVPFARAALPLCVLACIYCVWQQRDYLFTLTPVEVSRAAYGNQPFPEAVEIGRYIAAHSRDDARVAVLGSESEICFCAKRRSASGILFMYGMTEPSGYGDLLQRQEIAEIEGARPEYLVYVNLDVSWWWGAPGTIPANRLLGWMSEYIQEHYEITGVVDIRPDRTEYRWDAAAKGYSPESDVFVQVYRRRRREHDLK